MVTISLHFLLLNHIHGETSLFHSLFAVTLAALEIPAYSEVVNVPEDAVLGDSQTYIVLVGILEGAVLAKDAVDTVLVCTVPDCTEFGDALDSALVSALVYCGILEQGAAISDH